MRHLQSFLLLLLLFLHSCVSKERKHIHKLEGMWAIEEFSVNGKDGRMLLSSNLLVFFEDRKCKLPYVSWDGVTGGKWMIEYENNALFLLIQSENPLGKKYKVSFFNDDHRRLYCMILESDSIKMLCSKTLTTYKE